MTQLDTEPMTAGLRAGRSHDDAMAVLIQVPRVDEPRVRVRMWRPEHAARLRRAGAGRSRSMVARPRRRLRREVRLAGWWLLALASMGGTFTLGWMTRGSELLPLTVLSASTLVHDAGGASHEASADVPSLVGPAAAADAIAIGPGPNAPVADAEVPVVFPGYLLPDDSLEEPAHEGS